MFLLGSVSRVSGGESASPLPFLFFFLIAFRLSLQTGGFKPSVSPCSDAEGYLLVAAASAEGEGGAGRRRSRGGCRRRRPRYLPRRCRRKRGELVCKGERIAPHATPGLVNWVCSRIFPAVNVAQMEVGLSEIVVGCSAVSAALTAACVSCRVNLELKAGRIGYRRVKPCCSCPERDKSRTVHTARPSHCQRGTADSSLLHPLRSLEVLPGR